MADNVIEKKLNCSQPVYVSTQMNGRETASSSAKHEVGGVGKQAKVRWCSSHLLEKYEKIEHDILMLKSTTSSLTCLTTLPPVIIKI